jgi:basic membrane protein A
MKFRVILAAILLTGLIVPNPANSAELTVGVAYDTGGRGDRSFNDAAAAGLIKALKEFDFNLEAVVTDGASSDREKRVRYLISKNCNPIITIGSGYAPILQTLSGEFPDVDFAIINDATVSAPNVTSIVFADTQGAYLAGFSAAQISKSGKVAMIGNSDQEDIYKSGFQAGVVASKKKVTPVVKYVSGSYSAATSQVIAAGADVIFLTTQGSNADVFKVIVANNSKKKSGFTTLINVEPDQYLTVTNETKKFLAASVVKRVDKAIFDYLKKEASGNRNSEYLDETAGIYGYRYGIADSGIEFSIRSRDLLAKSDLINTAAVIAEKLPA